MFRRLAFTKAYTQSARLRVFLVSVMFLIVPLSLYFSLHTASRTKYFTDRNFRQLSNFSHQISRRIDNLGTAFSNSVDNFVRTKPGDGKDLRQDFQDYLNSLKADGANFTATTVERFPVVSEKTDLGLQVNINLAHEDGTPWLYFDCVGLKGKVHFTAKTNFDRLIRPLIGKTRDGAQVKVNVAEEFDHIIVARADTSKVLFESANEDLTLTSLDQVPLADASDKPLDLKTRSKTTDSVDITLAGSRYKLYAQPIEITLRTEDSQNAETLWVICGLVEASRFRYQTWAISHTVLIVSAFFAGLLLLSWPFLKLIFIGPKDRLRVAEALMLAVSVVIAGSLLTFFFLFGITYKQLEFKLDKQLFALATNFQNNFHQEVGRALKQIETLDSERQNPSKQNSQQHSQQQEKNKSQDGTLRTNLLTDICERGDCDQEKNPYPYFKMAFWVSDIGKQLVKWSTNYQNTKRLPVDTRDYFTKLTNGYYRELDGKRFWLEPINSRNTGAYTVVISREAKRDKFKDASVVALDTNLMSLTRPAIVSGFGYRIIDANGDVLFPNIKENFFAECENDNRLRSAVTGHLSDFVSVPFLGKDARVYVTPLQGLPGWTLIVFRDKEPLRSSFTEIVALSATLFLFYLLPLLLLVAILLLVSLIFGKRMKWMWPSADASPIYLQAIVVNILFIFIAWRVSAHLSYPGFFLLSLLSIMALLVMIVSLNRKWALKPSIALASLLERKWSWINERLFYSLCLLTLVLMIAVFPSLTFFRLAYDEEMDLFVKYGQVTLVNSLNEREERLRIAYPSGIFTDKDAAMKFLSARLKENLDTYYAFFFGTRIDAGSANINPTVPAGEETVLLDLRKRLPFSHPSSIVRHGLIANVSADGLWQWSNSDDSNLSLRAPQGNAKGDAFFNIASTTQRFPLHRLNLLPFIVVMILILFLLIRFILNRVFLLGTIESCPLDGRALTPASVGKSFVVLGPPYTGREKLLPAANFKVLNLNNGSEWPDKFNLKTFLRDAPSKAIAIESFEYQIDQPQYNLQKLDLLEKLLSHEGGLLVASTAEPTDYIFANGDKTTNGHSDASARWARVMSNFWIDYREDIGDPDAFKSELTEKQSNSQNEREKELYGLLVDECAPRAYLQEIGREIAKRRDLKESRRDDLISDVLVQANTYYRLIWESCSPAEKLTLAHLAVDGFLSINDPDVPRLVRRGLIVRPQEIRLMNESFRLFVLDTCRTDKVVAVTEGQARKSSNWQYLKVALSVTVVGLMAFLFVTQRDLYNSTLVALTSIAAGVPTVFNVFNLFQRNVGSSPSQPSH
jgi:hypothetical protein